MKIFITFLALMALAVDAQLEPDPFTTFISNYYNKRQSPQINYQSYVPYQNSATKRHQPYITRVTTPAPTTLVSFKSSTIRPQSNNPFIIASTTPIPFTYSSTTSFPTTFSPYKSPSVSPQSYKPYKTIAITRRPIVFSVTTPTPTVVSNILPESNEISTANSRQYIIAQSTSVPTRVPLYKASTLFPQFYRPYQSSAITSRPYIPFITTSVPSSVPIYNAPTRVPHYYRPYQSSTTTSRPYVPIVTTLVPTTVSPYKASTLTPPYYKPYQTPTTTSRPYIPVTTSISTTVPPYNAPTSAPQYYRPYKIPTTTRRPYVPVVTTLAPTTGPVYSTPSNTLYQITPTTLRPFIPFAPSTLQPYIPPSFVSPTTVHIKSDDRLANTRRSGNEINTDGSYNWFFNTDNGIAAQAQGTPKNYGGDRYVGENVQGAFSWTAPNGEFIDFTYTADENGYHPKSNAIPTPPPLPPHVVRLLEYLNRVAGSKK